MNDQGGSYSSQQERYSGATIKNPTVQFTRGKEFNDRDRLNDMLATEKWLTDNYNVFVRETSHHNLYRDILHILNETHHAARELFNLMFEKGWYSIQAEQPGQISKEYQKFSGYQSQFPEQGQYHTRSQHYSQGHFPPVDY
ncbi:MAG TPA: spore coat protein [Firmicutes bacterium]|nr:spore coat protein [Bacillota bacterium]